MVDLSQSTWLADLVDGELAAYDAAAARLKLPHELRSGDPDGPSLEARARTLLVRAVRPRLADAVPADPIEAFLRPIREHVQLLLDIALVLERPFDASLRRAELAALFATLGGEPSDAAAADPARPHKRSAAAVRRAFAIAAGTLVERSWPPGDPRCGLPLRAGLLVIERRQLARVAIDYHRSGKLEDGSVRRWFAQSRLETVVLFEALACAAAAGAPLDREALRAVLAQLRHLELSRALRNRARTAISSPRPADILAQSIEPRLRPFVLEQLLLGGLALGATAARNAYVERFAAEAGIPPEEVAALQSEAAFLYATEQRWLEPPHPQEAVSEEWHLAKQEMVERVASAFSDNFEALVTELKETGELGQLLAKAAGGQTLSADERAKVKAQLIDVAKAVPALAIFAAPGGMLLLPLLAKLLPFNMLPSAWGQAKPPAPAIAPATAPAIAPTIAPAIAPEIPPEPEMEPQKKTGSDA